MLCYVMLCYVMLCYVMLCYVMLCYVMLCLKESKSSHFNRTSSIVSSNFSVSLMFSNMNRSPHTGSNQAQATEKEKQRGGGTGV